MQSHNDVNGTLDTEVKKPSAATTKRPLTFYDIDRYAFVTIDPAIIDQLKITRDDLFTQRVVPEGILLKRWKKVFEMLGPKGTAPILPGTNMDTLNELIKLNVFEKVGSNRVRPTDEFIRVYIEVGAARYSEIDSPTSYDQAFALSERVKLVLPKLAAAQRKAIDGKKLEELTNDTTRWITFIQQTDTARTWSMF